MWGEEPPALIKFMEFGIDTLREIHALALADPRSPSVHPRWKVNEVLNQLNLDGSEIVKLPKLSEIKSKLAALRAGVLTQADISNPRCSILQDIEDVEMDEATSRASGLGVRYT